MINYPRLVCLEPCPYKTSVSGTQTARAVENMQLQAMHGQLNVSALEITPATNNTCFSSELLKCSAIF